LLKQDVTHLKLMALKVTRYVFDLRGPAELPCEPRLEAICGGLFSLMTRQNQVFAPFQRFVTAGKHPMRLSLPKEARLFEN